MVVKLGSITIKFELEYNLFYIKNPFTRKKIGFFVYDFSMHRVEFCHYCKEFYRIPVIGKRNLCDCYFV